MNTTGPNTATTAVRSHDTSGIPQNASHRPPVPDYASTDSSSGDEADDDDSEAEDFGTKSQTAHSTRQHKIYRQWHDHETGLLRNALRIHARNQAPRSTRTCHSCSKSLAAPGAKVVRCLSCGSALLWCRKCCLVKHSSGIALLHRY